MNTISKILTTLKAVGDHPLYRGRRAQAMVSFIWAQLVARARRGEIVVDFPNQTKLAVEPWVKGGAHYIFPRLCEFEEMSFVMHFLRPGDLFVDVGANLGAFTVLAAGVAGAEVVAFEPSPRTFERLRRNVDLNGLGARVQTVNAAVGRSAGVLRLSDNLGTENYVVTGSSDGMEVPVVTLDEKLAGKSPVLLKVDVEGFESEVFGGAVKMLANPTLVAMVVEHNDDCSRYGADASVLANRICAAGYKPHTYHPFERKLTPLEESSRGDLIYVRELGRALDRVRKAQPYTLGGAAI